MAGAGSAWAGWTCATTATSSNYTIDSTWAWDTWTADAVQTTGGNVWRYWTGTDNGSATVSDGTYRYWIQGDWNVTPEVIHESKEAKAQRLRQREALRLERERIEEVVHKAAEEERKKQKEADEKSLAFLVEHLEEGQVAALQKDGSFIVFGEKSKKAYRVKPGAMVDELGEKGEVKQRLCFHPVNPKIPANDRALSQAIMLRWCEDEALKIANRHPA